MPDQPEPDASQTHETGDPTVEEPAVTGENPESTAGKDGAVPENTAGRDRFVEMFMSKPSRGQALVAVLLAAVGFAAATQVQSNERDDDYTGLRQSDLIRVFDGLSGSSQRADAEIQRLTGLRDDLRTESSSRQAALDQARNDAQVFGILAGTLPVKGPGVRITITDPLGQVSARTLLDVI